MPVREPPRTEQFPPKRDGLNAASAAKPFRVPITLTPTTSQRAKGQPPRSKAKLVAKQPSSVPLGIQPHQRTDLATMVLQPFKPGPDEDHIAALLAEDLSDQYPPQHYLQGFV